MSIVPRGQLSRFLGGELRMAVTYGRQRSGGTERRFPGRVLVLVTALVLAALPGVSLHAEESVIHADSFSGPAGRTLSEHNSSYSKYAESDHIYLTGNDSAYTPVYGLEYYAGSFTALQTVQFDFRTDLSYAAQQFGVELYARGPGLRATDVYLFVFADGSGRIQNIDESHYAYFAAGHFADETTYTMTVTYDGSTATTYINGVEVDSFAQNISPFDSGSFAIQLMNYACIGNLVVRDSLTVPPAAEPPSLTCFSSDSDGDGVEDAEDQCSDSDLSDSVAVGSETTTVPNALLDGGCSINDLLQQAAAGAGSKDEFMSAVANLTNVLKQAGHLTGSQKGAIQSAAARSGLW